MAFLKDEDFFLPAKLSTGAAHLSRSGARFLATDCLFVDESGGQRSLDPGRAAWASLDQAVSADWRPQRSTLIVDAELARASGGGAPADGWSALLQAATRARRFPRRF